MANYIVNQKTTPNKIKAEVKAAEVEKIMEALNTIYGKDNVSIVRVGSKEKNSEKNIIAVRANTAEVNGAEVDVCLGIEITAKDFVERKTKSKTFYPFNFEGAKAKYEAWWEKKEEIRQSKIKADSED